MMILVTNNRHKTFTQKAKVVTDRAMKTCRVSGGVAPFILNVRTRWAELSISRPARFIARERNLVLTEKEI